MEIRDAQADMRQAYVGGGPGVVASGLVWLAAAAVSAQTSAEMGMLAFFFGGMLIHPLGVVGSKLLGRTGAHAEGNPLGTLALETTAPLLLGLLLAYAASRAVLGWFFPAMLVVIGGRYAAFSTLYGSRLYWVLAILLSFGGIALAAAEVPFWVPAAAGGAVEVAFGALLAGTAFRSGPR